jgi:hypothetical protein
VTNQEYENRDYEQQSQKYAPQPSQIDCEKTLHGARLITQITTQAPERSLVIQ